MVSNWKQRFYLLHKLIMSVTVETLTQVRPAWDLNERFICNQFTGNIIIGIEIYYHMFSLYQNRATFYRKTSVV